MNEVTQVKNDDTAPTARALSTAPAATYIALSESFLEKARTGQTKTPGPKFKKIGRRVVYLISDLDAYLDNPPTA